LRTTVFIDGYNLYYGAVRRTPYKWLDIFKLFNEQLLHHDTELLEVRYYTAPVLGSLCDDPTSPQRQRQYLQALRKMYPDKITVIEGKLIRGDAVLRLTNPLPEMPEISKVKVITLTEKKTDVNIAADMLAGAFTGQFEQAVLCSNDSDMEGALKIIRQHCPNIRLGLVAPTATTGRFISNDLKAQVHWAKTISPEEMALAQLPQKIKGTAITKPDAW
jgi:uncharacterized LabA/DUF88 family protein